MKTILRSALLVLVTVAGTLFAETPTDEAVIVELDQGAIQPGGVYSILTYSAPRAMTLAETGLKQAGLAAGPVIRASDEIRIFASREVMQVAPLARIWLNQSEGGAYWFHTGGSGSAESFLIPEGAAVVVWTRAGTTAVNWTNVFR